MKNNKIREGKSKRSGFKIKKRKMIKRSLKIKSSKALVRGKNNQLDSN